MIVPAKQLYSPPLSIKQTGWRIAVTVVVVGEFWCLGEKALLEPQFLNLFDPLFLLLPLLFVAGFALSIGLPLYCLYRALRLTAAWLFAAGAAAIAALFYALPDLINWLHRGAGSFGFSTATCDVAVNSVRTACGWAMFWQGIELYAAVGALTGVIFWLLLRWRAAPRRATPAVTNT